MKSSPAESYKRWRHSHGYGVHSPFAYDIVKEVLHPGRDYRYYAYTDIDNALENQGAWKCRREARILLRLAARMAVESAFLPQNVSHPFRIALLGADSRMCIRSAMSEISACRLIGTTGEYIPLPTLLGLLNTPGRIIAFRNVPPGWRERLFDALEEGLMFYGPHNLIVFCRPEMQKVAYSVRI